jgi:hypothetical protein
MASIASTQEIQQSLARLIQPGAWHELRALAVTNGSRKLTKAGWFDDPARMAKEAFRLNQAGANVYFSLNPTILELAARAENHVILAESGKCTNDEQIIERRWLFLDIDARKPLKDISADDREHTAAIDRSRQVRDWLLQECNWPAPVLVDSGNGAYLLFPIKLKNSQANTRLIERLLNALAERFDDDRATIDTGVFNASRIARIPGTINRKGDNIKTRPHRCSHVLEWPVEEEIVSPEQMEQIAREAGKETSPKESASANEEKQPAGMSLELKRVLTALAEKHGITASEPTRYRNSGWQYFLSACLFNHSHSGGRSISIIDYGDRQYYSCLHEPECRKNNRSTYSWADVLVKLGLGEKKTVGGFALTKLSDLLAMEFPETEYLWDKCLVIGTVSAVAAKPKVGKSTFARNLCLRTARGEDFLGLPTRKGACIYLALEERQEEVQADFKAMGADGTEPIWVHAAASPVEAMPALIEMVRERKPVLVVIDPLFRFAQVRDEKAYAETYAALGPLIDIARETGTHILFTHHAGKAMKADAIDAPLGSTAIGGAVSTLVYLRRTEQYRTIQTVQRVGEDMAVTVLQYDPVSHKVTLGGLRDDHERQECEERILEYLEDVKEPKTQEEIREAVEGRTKLIRAALTTLVKDNRLIRTGEGKKGKPFLYEFRFSGSPV